MSLLKFATASSLALGKLLLLHVSMNAGSEGSQDKILDFFATNTIFFDFFRLFMRSNVPKFLEHDLPLFYGILSDLFPAVDVPFIDYGLLQVCAKHTVGEYYCRVKRSDIFSWCYINSDMQRVVHVGKSSQFPHF